MCEGNEPRSGERIFRRSFLEASRYRACASPAYALLQTRHHGLQPWLHSYGAPRLPWLQFFRGPCPPPSGLLKPKQLVAQEPGLDAADPELLIVIEHDDEGAAWDRHDPADHIDVDDRSPAEPDETGRIETGGEITQP